jgi:hypothetical protein
MVVGNIGLEYNCPTAPQFPSFQSEQYSNEPVKRAGIERLITMTEVLFNLEANAGIWSDLALVRP